MRRTYMQRLLRGCNHLVGVVIAPKSLVPCAVYCADEDYEVSDLYVLMSPSRHLVYGAAYLDFPMWDEPHCLRQHALPGVCRQEDRDAGFGTALYLGGVMVTAAMQEDYSGQFPGSDQVSLGDGEYCTFSIETDDPYDDRGRSEPAESVWQRFLHRGWAQRVREPGRDTFNVLEWPTVLQTGLVLYLSRDFRPGRSQYNPREIVPPQVIGRLDWRETPVSEAVRYIEQNAGLLGDAQERAAYLAGCDDALSQTYPDIARALTRDNPTAATDSYNHFAVRDREWLALYGAGEWA